MGLRASTTAFSRRKNMKGQAYAEINTVAGKIRVTADNGLEAIQIGSAVIAETLGAGLPGKSKKEIAEAVAMSIWDNISKETKTKWWEKIVKFFTKTLVEKLTKKGILPAHKK